MDVKNSLIPVSRQGAEQPAHFQRRPECLHAPRNTPRRRLYLKDNIIGGSGFVKEVQGEEGSGNYKVIADEAAYTADSLKLLKAVSQQLAAALRKNQ